MPNPNISDAIVEAGGSVQGRKATTETFSNLISVDSSGYVVVGSSASTGVKLGGKLRVGGSVALTGTNPTAVTTGLSSIDYAQVSLRGTSAPGVGTSILTFGVSGGTLNVYAWKPTSSANPTLIASTGTETFDWYAVGTP